MSEAASVQGRVGQACEASGVTSALMPVLFLSHGGGPCFFLDERTSPMFAEMGKNSSSAAFFRGLRSHLPMQPRAIVIISAHWEERIVTIGAQPSGTSLIYDYYGFPPEAYELEYPAPTDMRLVERVETLLNDKGIRNTKMDRGFDHGVFIPLKLVWPEADIPIVQVSLMQSLDPEAHLQLGEALAPLRSEGVLIIGSGALTHSLREIHGPGSRPATWATEFVNWVHATLENEHVYDDSTREQMKNLMEVAPQAKRAHPRIEHLIPLHVAYGAAKASVTDGSAATRIYSETVAGTLSLDQYMFT